MKISKYVIARVGEAECIPKGYGLAYWDHLGREGIFYPIPFNLIARLLLVIYQAIIRGFYPNWFEHKMLAEYKRGWDDAYKDSYEKGLKDGIRDGYAERQKEYDSLWEAYLAVPSGERSKWLDELDRTLPVNKEAK